jgi:hypothetical protein
VRTIHALGSARYSGRTDAELTLGDIMLCLREPALGGDGSALIICQQQGMLPRNWMPGGSVITKRPGGYIIEHAAKGEALEVFIDTIYNEHAQPAGTRGELHKMGAEREFSDLIAANLDRLGPRGTYELVAREWRTTAGPVDLLLRETATGCPVVVEVKRSRIGPADLYQLRRYTDALASMDEWSCYEARGIMVAPVLSKNAKPLIDSDPVVRFVRLSYQDLAGPLADIVSG